MIRSNNNMSGIWYTIVVDIENGAKLDEIIWWVRSMCKGYWQKDTLGSNGVYALLFEELDDAILFKLAWL
jgi:hypothetical protein